MNFSFINMKKISNIFLKVATGGTVTLGIFKLNFKVQFWRQYISFKTNYFTVIFVFSACKLNKKLTVPPHSPGTN